jgi:hypothetical protein
MEQELTLHEERRDGILLFRMVGLTPYIQIFPSEWSAVEGMARKAE